MVRSRSVQQGHAVVAASHHDRPKPMLCPQMLGSRDDLRLGFHRHVGGGGEFLTVRHHHVGAGIAGKIAAARIDDQLATGLARRFHQFRWHVGGQHPLAVVRQHRDTGRRHRIHRDPQQSFGQFRVNWIRLLAIRTQQLLAGGDQARLQRGRAAALHQQPGFHVRLATDQAGQFRSGLVIADDRDESRRHTQGRQVAHHVPRTAGQRDLPLDRQDRHRRFQADPGHLAIGVPVHHHIADDQYVGVRQPPNRRSEIRLWLIRARRGAGRDLIHSTCRNKAVAMVQPIFACGHGKKQAPITNSRRYL